MSSKSTQSSQSKEEQFNAGYSIQDNLIADLRVLWTHFNSQAQPSYQNADGQTVNRTDNAIRFATNMRDKVQKMAGLINGLR